MKNVQNVLEEAQWLNVKEISYKIAILPWGATEPHNYHLPYGTDSLESKAVAELSAKKAASSAPGIMVLPTIPFGVNTGQKDLPFAINIHVSTQMALITDIVVSLKNRGIDRLVIINSHGGNNFNTIAREVQYKHPEVTIFVIDWWKNVINPKEIFAEPGDHAGELETSVMMHIHPNLVLPINLAGDGNSKKGKLQGMKEGWAWTERPWTTVTESTGIGDPQKASAEKGALMLNKVTEKIAQFLIELYSADLKNLYE